MSPSLLIQTSPIYSLAKALSNFTCEAAVMILRGFLILFYLGGALTGNAHRSEITKGSSEEDKNPSIFMLDDHGHLHADYHQRHAVTSATEREKLKQRIKRPIADVLSEVLSEKVAPRDDVYGGVVTLTGDTAATKDEDFENAQFGERYKRQLNSQAHQLEIVMIFDYALYRFWLGRNNFNEQRTKDEMMDYYANIVNAVNTRYESLRSSDFSLRIAVTKFIIGTSPSSTPWTQMLNVSNTVDTTQALDMFAAWIDNNSTLLLSDHAITISGYDLAEGNKSGLVGLAFQNGTCKKKFSTSLSESLKTQETATLVAHELAHSMGSNHDSDGNSCAAGKKQIMAPSIAIPDRSMASNPWRFSVCSLTSIKEYLNRAPGLCTLRRQAAEVSLAPYLREEFGQKYPHDVQCEIFRGQNAKFCRNLYINQTRTFDDLCYEFYCLDPVKKACFATLAHDGTSCGNKKWCRSGQCVSSSAAPATPVNCPAGDDPDVNCAARDCADVRTRDVLCCSTCKAVVPSISTSFPFFPPTTQIIPTQAPFVPFFPPVPTFPSPFQPQTQLQTLNQFPVNGFFARKDPFSPGKPFPLSPFEPRDVFKPRDPFFSRPSPQRRNNQGFSFFNNIDNELRQLFNGFFNTGNSFGRK